MSLKVKLLRLMQMMGVIGCLHSPLMATDGPPSKEGLPLLNTSVRKIHHAPAIGESLGGEEEKVNLTFFPFSGQAEFYREEYNLILGRQLNVWGVGLFSSNGFDGALIREVSGFNWSHVGMILVDEKTKDLFCFQSTAKVDKLLQGVMPQVQISKWDEEVREYDGKVACRALIFSDKRPDSEIVMNYIKENLGRSYETNLLSLIKATNNSNKQESLDTLFCSEMSADLLIKLGFLDQSFRLATNCVPGHFAAENDKKYLRFINGAALGNQVVVKDKKATNIVSTRTSIVPELPAKSKKKSGLCCTIL